MCIKDFSKVFTLRTEINESYFYNKIIAIDAMNILYRYEKSPCILTGLDGDYTHTLNILLYDITRRRKNGIREIWCFDHREKNYVNPLKIDELNIRRIKKNKVLSEIDIINNSLNFKSIDDKDKKLLEEKLYKKKKQFIGISDKRLNEVKFILQNYNIPYIDCPRGIEGEQMCAILSINNIVDYVISEDHDTFLFGAKKIIKKYTDRKTKEKKMFLYVLDDILNKYNLTRMELIMIGIILGCDFYKNKQMFKGIGYKTVLNSIKKNNIIDKFNDKKLQRVIGFFKNEYINIDSQSIQNAKIKLENFYNKPLNEDKINILSQWLITNKGFNNKKINNILNN